MADNLEKYFDLYSSLELPKNVSFENLTSEQTELIKNIHSDKSISYENRIEGISKLFLITKRNVYYWLNKLGLSISTIESGKDFQNAKQRTIPKSRIYFITSAQNATPIHVEFWENMKALADVYKAKICVIPIRYKNPTSIHQDRRHDEWAKEVEPYLVASRFEIGNDVEVLADVKTQPTATNPTSSFRTWSGNKTLVVGHPKQHLMTFAMPEKPKRVFSTGSCTIRNYTDSKAGKNGDNEHELGFVIVEVNAKGETLTRYVTASKDGSFNDFNIHVSNQEIKANQKGGVFILGDKHGIARNERLHKMQQSIISHIKPEYVVLHDVFDGESISHHDAKDPFLMASKYKDDKLSLDKELSDLYAMIDGYNDTQIKVIESNHDNFLDKWLMWNDGKKDFINSECYFKYGQLKHQFPNQSVIATLLESRFDNVECFDRNKALYYKGILLSYHGDIGANGARGSMTTFSKLPIKNITGHGHWNWKKGKGYGVATSTDERQSYQKGLSRTSFGDVYIPTTGIPQHFLYDSRCRLSFIDFSKI